MFDTRGLYLTSSWLLYRLCPRLWAACCSAHPWHHQTQNGCQVAQSLINTYVEYPCSLVFLADVRAAQHIVCCCCIRACVLAWLLQAHQLDLVTTAQHCATLQLLIHAGSDTNTSTTRHTSQVRRLQEAGVIANVWQHLCAARLLSEQKRVTSGAQSQNACTQHRQTRSKPCVTETT
jgi:hypothetical protein